MREVLGYAGDILIRYGYAKDPSNDARGGYEWRVDYRRVGKGYEEVLYYGASEYGPSALKPTDVMLQTTQEYHGLVQRLAELRRSLSTSKERKSKEQVQDLWDNV